MLRLTCTNGSQTFLSNNKDYNAYILTHKIRSFYWILHLNYTRYQKIKHKIWHINFHKHNIDKGFNMGDEIFIIKCNRSNGNGQIEIALSFSDDIIIMRDKILADNEIENFYENKKLPIRNNKGVNNG